MEKRAMNFKLPTQEFHFKLRLTNQIDEGLCADPTFPGMRHQQVAGSESARLVIYYIIIIVVVVIIIIIIIIIITLFNFI
jgi:hypothetical protein